MFGIPELFASPLAIMLTSGGSKEEFEFSFDSVTDDLDKGGGDDFSNDDDDAFVDCPDGKRWLARCCDTLEFDIVDSKEHIGREEVFRVVPVDDADEAVTETLVQRKELGNSIADLEVCAAKAPAWSVNSAEVWNPVEHTLEKLPRCNVSEVDIHPVETVTGALVLHGESVDL